MNTQSTLDRNRSLKKECKSGESQKSGHSVSHIGAASVTSAAHIGWRSSSSRNEPKGSFGNKYGQTNKEGQIELKRPSVFKIRSVDMKLMLNLIMLLMMVVGAGEALSGERSPSYDCVAVQKSKKSKKKKSRSLASKKKNRTKVVFAHFNAQLCKDEGEL